MRKQPSELNIQPPQIIHHIHEKTTEQQRRYKIITPLFGGGAIDHTCDEITTIRGTKIRGHLRFWWRATCAGHLANIQAIKEREDLIWGKANKKKKIDSKNEEIAQDKTDKRNENGPKHEETVQIEVSVQKKTELVAPFTIIIGKNSYGKLVYKPKPVPSTRIPPYVAFPIQPTSKDLAKLPQPPPKKINSEELDSYTKKISKEGIEFTLTITFPNEYVKEVETALLAWETFGGIGARTRRGFGALQLLTINGKDPKKDDIPASFEQAVDWLVQKLKEMSTKDHGFPYISPNLRFKIIKASDPISGWETLIKKLAMFRHGADGNNNTGKSNWPEANAIRELTGEQHSSRYLKKFPRAAFGLPIIFHFAKDRPPDATLQASEDNDRLASPLIIKPLLCQNGQTCALAIILDGYKIPSSLTLKEQNGKPHKVEHQLASADVRALPSLKLNKKVDILEAFLDYLVGDSK